MKKTTLLKSMLLLCALIVGTNSWADDPVTVTWNINGVTATNQNYAAPGGQVNTTLKTSSITPDGASGIWTAYSNTSTSYAASSTGAQLGAGSGREFNGTITLSSTSIPSNATINSVTVTAKSNGSSTLSATVGGNSLGANQTITGTTATEYTFNTTSRVGNAIVLTLSGTTASKYINISKIVVVYTPSSEVINVTGVSLNKNATTLYVGDSEKLTATIAPETASNKNVSWESNHTEYATVDDKGNVTAVAAGTARITVTTEDGSKTDYCDVTVLPAPTAVVTLDFTTNDWGISESPTKTEDANEFTSGGYTITLEGSSGNGYYFDTDNIMLGKSGATLTLPAFGFKVSKIKVYGDSDGSSSVTFNVFVGDDPVSTSATSSKVEHEFAIAAGKQNVGTIYVIKVTNAYNMRISKIEVFGNGCEAGAVQSYGWATYITTSNVEYPANTAFVVTDASVSTGLTVEEVTQVPTGTPLLLKGEGAKTAIELDAAPAVPATNLLSVSDGSALGSGEYAYVLAKNGDGACFKQWTGTMSSLNGRVILVLDEAVATARELFDLGNETTGIAEVRGMKENVRGEYFNLAGQRVARPTKGLYIVNGKKVIIK